MMLLLTVAKKSYTMGKGGLVWGSMYLMFLVGQVLAAPSIVPGTLPLLRGFSERNDYSWHQSQRLLAVNR